MKEFQEPQDTLVVLGSLNFWGLTEGLRSLDFKNIILYNQTTL